MSDSQEAAKKALLKLPDQLTCSICLDTYRDPKVLPCLHVFCMTCIEKLVSQDGTSLTCPKCRRTTQAPQGGVSELQSAFYINHLFDVRDTLKKVKDARIECQHCGENEATGYCRNCSEFYCQSCIEVHKKWKALADHDIAMFEVVQAEAINLVPTKKAIMACSKHPGKSLEIYCETCEELICHNCTVKSHHYHEYDLVGDCFHKHRDAITASVQPVRRQLDSINQAVGEIDARSQRLAEQILPTKQKIQVEIDQLQNALEARKRELMAHVDEVAKQTGKTLQAQREGYELNLTQHSSCLEYVEESLRTGSQEEILSMKKQFVERMEQMTKEKFQPELEETLQFSQQRLTEACQGFGEVFTCPLCPEKSYATGEGVHGTHKDVAVTLTLQTVDTREQPCTDPEAPVTGELVSRGDGGVVKCQVTRKKDNTYELKYQPRTAGEHDLHIKVYGRHIKDSPFTVTVGGFQCIHVKTIEGVMYPRHLVTTGNGEIVVTEIGANCISVLDRDGRKLRSFGNTGTGDSELSNPRGVTLCSDNTVLVAAEHCVKRFTLEGGFITSVGSQGSGQLQFDTPWAVTFNPTNKKVYVCDTNNHRIEVLNSDLTFSSTIGSKGNGPGQFQSPDGIAVDRTGNIYVADRENNRIQVYSPTDQLLREISQRGPGMEALQDPVSVCIDSHNFMYVLEFCADRVSVFNSEGEFVKSFGQRGDKAGEFKNPWAIAVDTAGHVYVSDSGNNRIQIFT